MLELERLENVNIVNMIYEIRGKQVMLDSDLAKLYQCSNGAKSINQAVKRHINRFPNRFMFQLTEEETKSLWSQIGTTKNNKRRTLPYVFTEQGVAMLSSILRTKVATQVSIAIMDAFTEMRKYISNNFVEQKYINEIVLKDSKRIDLLEEIFNKFKSNSNEIFFEGQIYDAYSKIIDIMKLAHQELIVIDRYADKSVLDMIKNIKCNVILICKINSLIKGIDLEKYNKQYSNLKIIYDDSYHDRYFILDQDIIYHCGASINHAGSRTFSINKLEDKVVIDNLINKVYNLLKVSYGK